jgi:sodium/proline symporter
VTSLLAWGLGYFGQPHILARFQAISSAQSVPRARRIGVTWAALSLAGASLVGLSGTAYFPATLAGPDAEKVFILLVRTLFNPLIAGFCLAAVLAAIMSTASSQMLVASAAFTQDLYKKLFRRDAQEAELVRTGRIAVLAVAFLALLLALDPESKVLELVAYAWAGFGAAFGPPLILSLYWRGMSRAGAAAGITTGALTVVIWKQFHGGIFDVYEMVPGCIQATLITVLVSLVWRPEKATAAELDRIGGGS